MAVEVGLQPGQRSVTHEAFEDTPLEKVSFSLPLEGSYDQLIGFLGQVERSPRFLLVDSVSMHGEPGTARLQVRLSTFMQAPPGAGGEGRARRGRR
jgi:hypothetical protein